MERARREKEVEADMKWDEKQREPMRKNAENAMRWREEEDRRGRRRRIGRGGRRRHSGEG